MMQLYSIHVNKPELITLQLRSFQKFCLQPFELNIVNNARDNTLRGAITDQCNDLRLNCIHTYSEYELVGSHHQWALNAVWQNEACHKKDLVGIMDGDVFPLADFFIKEGDWTIHAAPQHRKGYEYLSPVIVFLNMPALPNAKEIDWTGTEVASGVHLDSGGNIYYYLTKYPEVKDKVKLMPQTWHISEKNQNMDILPEKVKAAYKQGYDVEIFDEKFLHYCASSGWRNYETDAFHIAKTNWVTQFVNSCIDRWIHFAPPYFNMQNEYLGWPNA